MPDRFWAKVDKDGPVIRPELGPCWIWIAARNKHGYGLFDFEGQWRQAHVVAYILTTGHEPPPEAPKITHLCDGGEIGCVRPSHLLADTQAGNLAGMVARGRSARGERSGKAKLTDVQARELVSRWRAGGVTQVTLADEYDLSKAQVCRIVGGKRWRHLV